MFRILRTKSTMSTILAIFIIMIGLSGLAQPATRTYAKETTPAASDKVATSSPTDQGFQTWLPEGFTLVSHTATDSQTTCAWTEYLAVYDSYVNGTHLILSGPANVYDCPQSHEYYVNYNLRGLGSNGLTYHATGAVDVHTSVKNIRGIWYRVEVNNSDFTIKEVGGSRLCQDVHYYSYYYRLSDGSFDHYSITVQEQCH
jgi:hypothetical protein